MKVLFSSFSKNGYAVWLNPLYKSLAKLRVRALSSTFTAIVPSVTKPPSDGRSKILYDGLRDVRHDTSVMGKMHALSKQSKGFRYAQHLVLLYRVVEELALFGNLFAILI